MIDKLKKRIRKWYQGTPYENDPKSRILVLGVWERHWTARAARWTVKYWKKEYKFIVSTILGLIGIVLALMIK